MAVDGIVRSISDMLITAVDTLQLAAHPNFFFVEIHTDDGLIGLGQTADSRRTAPVVQEFAERFLVGQDPCQVERLWTTLFRAASYHGYSGAEMRAISAIDIALWDILGQSTGRPIWALLGGTCRDSIPIYNTCSAYLERSDRDMVRRDPVGLADELLEAGISALKYAPFDQLANARLGQYLSDEEIALGVEPIRKIAAKYGTRFQVAIEGHSLLNLPTSIRIAQAVEDLPILWLEDLLPPDTPSQTAQLRARSSALICGSERLFTRYQHLPLLEQAAVDVLMADITWTGGISELKKMAIMADIYHIPISPHDHSGPVNLFASAHVLVNVPNAMIMESTRVFYDTYYQELVTVPHTIKNGHLLAPVGPGLGTALLPDVRRRADCTVTRIGL
jgi:galactonate dehydratase